MLLERKKLPSHTHTDQLGFQIRNTRTDGFRFRFRFRFRFKFRFRFRFRPSEWVPGAGARL